MSEPVHPPANPDGYPGKPPAQPVPANANAVEQEVVDELLRHPLDRPWKEDL